jgi:hypothetical protein
VQGAESWRNQILREFTPQVARLMVVADPDGLLTEEGIVQGLREQGFDLILFDDPVAFRFAYESKYRSRWDRGELTDLVVVLRAATHDLQALPYDLLQAGRRLSFSLGELFPHLSYPVIAALDRSDLDALYRAQIQQNPGRLGNNATKDFVLRHVFEIAPELIKRSPDLLRVLLRRHYQGQRVSAMLDERFIQVMRQNKNFDDWPLEQIVADRDAFFAFLQERWPRFVRRWLARADTSQSRGTGPAIAESEMDTKVAGPVDLPFDHDDVRVYIDNLFLEGLLQPIAVSDLEVTAQGPERSFGWVAVGMRIDPVKDHGRRLERLLQTVEASLPGKEARGQDWLAFARRWAELTLLWYDANGSGRSFLLPQFRTVQEQVDATFIAWIQQRYGSLYNQPALPPLMLHHVPRVLARHLQQSGTEKVALLLLDGLALDQWLVLRDVLTQLQPRMSFHDEAVFAWLPTTTSVSRQACSPSSLSPRVGGGNRGDG